MKLFTVSVLVGLFLIRFWTSPYAQKKRILYKKLNQNEAQQKAYPNSVSVNSQATKSGDVYTVAAQVLSENSKQIEGRWHMESLEFIEGSPIFQITTSSDPVLLTQKFRLLKSGKPILFLEVFENTPQGKLGIMHPVDLSDPVEMAFKSITKKLKSTEGKVLQ